MKAFNKSKCNYSILYKTIAVHIQLKPSKLVLADIEIFEFVFKQIPDRYNKYSSFVHRKFLSLVLFYYFLPSHHIV